MAYIISDEQKRKLASAGYQNNLVGEPGSPPEGGDTNAPQKFSPAGGQAPSGSGFINLGDYLSANEGRGQKMASDLSNAAENEGRAASDALSGAQRQFQEDVSRGSTQEGAAQDYYNQYNNSPTNTQWKAKGGLLGAADRTYSGPNGLGVGADDPLNAQVTRAQNLAQGMSNGIGGYNQAVQEYYKPQNYTTGMGALDASLIGTAQPNAAPLAGYLNLGNDLQSALSSAGTQAASAKATTANEATKAQGYLDQINNAPSPVPPVGPDNPTSLPAPNDGRPPLPPSGPVPGSVPNGRAGSGAPTAGGSIVPMSGTFPNAGGTSVTYPPGTLYNRANGMFYIPGHGWMTRDQAANGVRNGWR